MLKKSHIKYLSKKEKYKLQKELKKKKYKNKKDEKKLVNSLFSMFFGNEIDEDEKK